VWSVEGAPSEDLVPATSCQARPFTGRRPERGGGVFLLAIQSKDGTAEGVAAAAATAIVIWDLGSCLKSRMGRKPGHPTAEPS
jgi:hypothetical protein